MMLPNIIGAGSKATNEKLYTVTITPEINGRPTDDSVRANYKLWRLTSTATTSAT